MTENVLQWGLASPFFIAILLYTFFVFRSNRRYKPWPMYRTVLLIIGCIFAIISLIGPIPYYSHHYFPYHMLGHLFLGMIAPLCIVLAAPLTLVLRSIPVNIARRLIRILQHRYFYWITDPFVASLLNVGILWLLYTTDLYEWMHHRVWLYAFIHIHMFVAGYVNTVSFIYMDPIPHRRSYRYRVIAMLLAMASHSILSKFIVAHPPVHVPFHHAEIGGMIMYYGGDLVDIVIITMFCFQWYRERQKGMRRLLDNPNAIKS